jgi:hypothetical protein
VKVTIAGGKLRAKRGVVTVKITASGPFSGVLALSAKKLGKVGTARVALTKAGSVTVKVRLSAKARRARRLSVDAVLGTAKAKLTISR